MLWPEGAPHRLAPLGSYVEPKIDGEQVRDVCFSTTGSYMAVVSEHVLALLRIKPLCPVALYPGLNPPEEHYKFVATSLNGALVATVTSKNNVEISSVHPQANLEEVLKINYPLVPGPGEAIGVRELWLGPLHKLNVDFEVRGLVGVGSDAFAIVGPQHFQVWSPGSEKFSRILLAENPGEEFVSAQYVKPYVLSLRTNRDRLLILSAGEDPADVAGPEFSDIRAADYNARLNKYAAITTSNKLVVGDQELDVPAHDYVTVRWTGAGTALALGHSRGWTLVSMLGTLLYDMEGELTTRMDWIGDALIVLANGTLYMHSLLRNALSGGSGRPVLYGSGRLLVYHDSPSVQAGPWLTAPLPTWYMASNWPLSFAVASDDGRFVAIAGTIGIMYFSALTRQWRELSDRESSVRGGLLWYGRRLVAATVSRNLEYKLKMWSPVPASSQVPSSAQESEQVVAHESLDGPPVAISLCGHLLGVLVGGTSPRLVIYSLMRQEFDIVREMPLTRVVEGPVRALTVIDSQRALFLVGSSLVLVTVVDDTEVPRYKRQTLAAPIETYFFQPLSRDQLLWVWDGQDAVAMSLKEDEDEDEDPSGKSLRHSKESQPSQNHILATIPLDAYPVWASANRGALVVVEAEPVKSMEGSFTLAQSATSLEVFVPYLLEAALGDLGRVRQIARRYMKLPYFGQVLETVLYHAVINIHSDKEPSPLVSTIQLLDMPPFTEQKLPVVAACARKVEMKYWPRLFEALDMQPPQLFDQALTQGDLAVAAEFLLVVQAHESSDAGGHRAMALYQAARKAGQFQICRELCEFLVAVDPSGATLRDFYDRANR